MNTCAWGERQQWSTHTWACPSLNHLWDPSGWPVPNLCRDGRGSGMPPSSHICKLMRSYSQYLWGTKVSEWSFFMISLICLVEIKSPNDHSSIFLLKMFYYKDTILSRSSSHWKKTLRWFGFNGSGKKEMLNSISKPVQWCEKMCQNVIQREQCSLLNVAAKKNNMCVQNVCPVCCLSPIWYSPFWPLWG